MSFAVIIAVLMAPASSNAGNCPSPKTCDRFTYLNSVMRTWPPAIDGLVHIPYFVNPKQPWLPESDAVAAIRAAFATWQGAVPLVRFEYQGITMRAPLPRDGINIVGWGPAGPTAETWLTTEGSRIVEADTIFGLPGYAHLWYPCEQRDGSCTPLNRDLFKDWYVTGAVWPFTAPGLEPILDIQNTMTHEVGHWLWLGHVEDEAGSELTMYGGGGADSANNVVRKRVTLGLGDVLGARSLYPCSCPLPAVYEP